MTSGEAIRSATKAPAVLAVAAGAGGIVVAAVEGRSELAVMSTSASGDQVNLKLEYWLPLPAPRNSSVDLTTETAETQPASVVFDASGKRLWCVGTVTTAADAAAAAAAAAEGAKVVPSWRGP
jgi:hypothetical protein